MRSLTSILPAAISFTRYSMYSSLVRYVVVLSLGISIQVSPLNLYSLFGKLSTLTKRSPFSALLENCVPNSAFACLSKSDASSYDFSLINPLGIIFFFGPRWALL